MRAELPVLPLFGCRRVEDGCCCWCVQRASNCAISQSWPLATRCAFATHPSPPLRGPPAAPLRAYCAQPDSTAGSSARRIAAFTHAAPGRRSASRPSFAALCLRPARTARLCPHSHGSPPADRITMSSRGHVSASGFGTRRARVRSLSRSLSCTHASGVRCQTPGDAVPSQL